MSIYIELGDNLVLTNDSRQYVLNKARKCQGGVAGQDGSINYKAGDIVLSPYRFYSDINMAAHGIMNEKIRASDASTLKEILDTVRQFRSETFPLIRSASFFSEGNLTKKGTRQKKVLDNIDDIL